MMQMDSTYLKYSNLGVGGWYLDNHFGIKIFTSIGNN